MNPRMNDGGLQLGASCCNRLHDRSPRDVDGSVPVSIATKATLDALKNGLTLAVGFLAVSTHATRPRRIGRVYD